MTEDGAQLLVAALSRGTPAEGASVAFEPSSGELALLSIDIVECEPAPAQ